MAIFILLILTSSLCALSPPKEAPISSKEWSQCLSFCDRHEDQFLSHPSISPQAGLPLPLVRDLKTGITYIHLKGRKAARIGHGFFKIVTKSICLTQHPFVVARCEGNKGLLEEAEIFQRLIGKRGIPRMYSCIHIAENRYDLMLQYFNQGCLKRYREAHPFLSTDFLLALVHDTLSGLQALHDAGFVHRDLHAKNILLSKSATLWSAALVDFGSASPIANKPKIDSFFSPWSFPEELLNVEGSFDIRKTDAFRLATQLYMAFRPDPPSWVSLIKRHELSSLSTSTRQELYQKMRTQFKKEYEEMPETGIRQKLLRLVFLLLHPNPDHRPSLQSVRLRIEILKSQTI